MRQGILEKLFDNKELSSEELIFISKNLQDAEEIVPYDHSLDTPMENCGLAMEDINRANIAFTKLVHETTDRQFSRLVESMEKLVLADEKLLRLMLVQQVKAAMDNHASGRMQIITGKGSDALLQALLKAISGKKDDEKEDNPE